MKFLKRLSEYVLLNILFSVITILIVLGLRVVDGRFDYYQIVKYSFHYFYEVFFLIFIANFSAILPITWFLSTTLIKRGRFRRYIVSLIIFLVGSTVLFLKTGVNLFFSEREIYAELSISFLIAPMIVLFLFRKEEDANEISNEKVLND